MKTRLETTLLLLIALLFCLPHSVTVQTKLAEPPEKVVPAAVDEDANVPAEVEKASLGGTRNVHRVGDLFLAGQFTPEDVAIIKQAGINRVVSLQTDGEVKWDEEQAVLDAGMNSTPSQSKVLNP